MGVSVYHSDEVEKASRYRVDGINKNDFITLYHAASTTTIVIRSLGILIWEH